MNDIRITAYIPPDMESRNNEELCELAQAGNVDAANVLVFRNGGFISDLAYNFFEERFRGETEYSVTWEDLLQEARLAFWQGIFRFDPARKLRLITFAGKCIQNALSDYWDRFCMENRFERQYRREEAGQKSSPEVEYEKPHDADDEPRGGSDEQLYDDPVLDEYRKRPEPILLEKETKEEICRTVCLLPPRVQEYLCYRFGYPSEDERSLKETAEHFSLRARRAEMIERDALAALSRGLHQ